MSNSTCTIKKSSNLNFKTSFSDIKIEGEIKVQVSTVKSQLPKQTLADEFLPKRPSLLKSLSLEADDEILLIDCFYPLTKNPDKKFTGGRRGRKCLDSLLKEFPNIKVVIFTSVTKDKYMRKFLDEEGYKKIEDTDDFFKTI